MQKRKSQSRIHYLVPWKTQPDLYKSFDQLEKTIEYRFNNQALLFQAMTHSSMVKKTAKPSAMTMRESCSLERLEFLGDAVLGLMVAHHIFTQIPLDSEGALSKLRSLIVNEERLAKVAKGLKLGQFIIFGESEVSSSGHLKPRILADCMEALIGALFQDAGFDFAQKFIIKLFDFENINLNEIKSTWNNDYKSMLQEHLQSAKKGPPTYSTIQVKGSGELQKFLIGVFFEGQKIAEAQASSKKVASQRAAEKAWNLIKSKKEQKL